MEEEHCFIKSSCLLHILLLVLEISTNYLLMMRLSDVVFDTGYREKGYRFYNFINCVFPIEGLVLFSNGALLKFW